MREVHAGRSLAIKVVPALIFFLYFIFLFYLGRSPQEGLSPQRSRAIQDEEAGVVVVGESGDEEVVGESGDEEVVEVGVAREAAGERRGGEEPRARDAGGQGMAGERAGVEGAGEKRGDPVSLRGAATRKAKRVCAAGGGGGGGRGTAKKARGGAGSRDGKRQGSLTSFFQAVPSPSKN